MPRRDLLSDTRALMRAARSGIFTLAEGAAALQLSHREATLRLRAMARYRVIRRISRGLFFIVRIQKWEPKGERPANSATVASALFSPCYIGGWTAAERWYLCSPGRPRIFVATSSRARAPAGRIGGYRFRLARVPEDRVAGHGIVQGHGDAAPISNPERTLVDALRSPWWLGGARPLAEALRNYWWEGPDRDPFTEMLMEVANGPAVKRLMALNHHLDLGIADVLQPVLERRTHGIVDLEPGAGSKGPIDTHSGVRMNVCLEGEDLERDYAAWCDEEDDEWDD